MFLSSKKKLVYAKMLTRTKKEFIIFSAFPEKFVDAIIKWLEDTSDSPEYLANLHSAVQGAICKVDSCYECELNNRECGKTIVDPDWCKTEKLIIEWGITHLKGGNGFTPIYY